jgi:hypothetical protein
MAEARRRVRWRALTAAGAVVLAGLAGCDDEAAPSPAPPEPSSTSPSPTEPTGSPAPTLPVEAKGKSVASAKAFARYFIEAVNFAIRTGDARPVMDVSTPGCVTCNAVKRNAERIYGAGGRIEGGQMAVNTVTVVTPPPDIALLLGVSYSAERVVEPGKDVVRRGPTKGSLTMFLKWQNGEWVVDRLVVTN